MGREKIKGAEAGKKHEHNDDNKDGTKEKHANSSKNVESQETVNPGDDIGKVTNADKTTIGEVVSGKEATTKTFIIVALVNTQHESYSETIQAILDKAKYANADNYFLVVSCFGRGESLRKVWSKLWSANNKNKSRLKYDTFRRINWKYADAVPPLLSKVWESDGKASPVSFFHVDRHSNILKVCEAPP